MHTSVMEVHDMLAVLSVDDVEKRIDEVPGVDSVTASYAEGPDQWHSVTPRLDVRETH